MEKIIARGAEAVLVRNGSFLIKKRIAKNYRIKELDEKIRRRRTRSEAKLLQKLSFVPKVSRVDENQMTITMDFLDGNLLRDILDDLSLKDRKNICLSIGKQIAVMHAQDIIHGDLTTSNMIFFDKQVYFIDFGLGFTSHKLEDKATDLRLLRQALESTHFLHFKESYEFILEGYRETSSTSDVLKWLDQKVEKRGRYKRKEK